MANFITNWWARQKAAFSMQREIKRRDVHVQNYINEHNAAIREIDDKPIHRFDREMQKHAYTFAKFDGGNATNQHVIAVTQSNDRIGQLAAQAGGGGFLGRIFSTLFGGASNNATVRAMESFDTMNVIRNTNPTNQILKLNNHEAIIRGGSMSIEQAYSSNLTGNQAHVNPEVLLHQARGIVNLYNNPVVQPQAQQQQPQMQQQQPQVQQQQPQVQQNQAAPAGFNAQQPQPHAQQQGYVVGEVPRVPGRVRQNTETTQQFRRRVALSIQQSVFNQTGSTDTADEVRQSWLRDGTDRRRQPGENDNDYNLRMFQEKAAYKMDSSPMSYTKVEALRAVSTEYRQQWEQRNNAYTQAPETPETAAQALQSQATYEARRQQLLGEILPDVATNIAALEKQDRDIASGVLITHEALLAAQTQSQAAQPEVQAEQPDQVQVQQADPSIQDDPSVAPSDLTEQQQQQPKPYQVPRVEGRERLPDESVDDYKARISEVIMAAAMEGKEDNHFNTSMAQGAVYDWRNNGTDTRRKENESDDAYNLRMFGERAAFKMDLDPKLTEKEAIHQVTLEYKSEVDRIKSEYEYTGLGNIDTEYQKRVSDLKTKVGTTAAMTIASLEKAEREINSGLLVPNEEHKKHQPAVVKIDFDELPDGHTATVQGGVVKTEPAKESTSKKDVSAEMTGKANEQTSKIIEKPPEEKDLQKDKGKSNT